jgi:hypothetical protein
MMMPYWDVWDEGVFVGGAFSGSPLHVDQVSWSNIGKNFIGCVCSRYAHVPLSQQILLFLPILQIENPA